MGERCRHGCGNSPTRKLKQSRVDFGLSLIPGPVVRLMPQNGIFNINACVRWKPGYKTVRCQIQAINNAAARLSFCPGWRPWMRYTLGTGQYCSARPTSVEA
jgi:hypothetical protein